MHKNSSLKLEFYRKIMPDTNTVAQALRLRCE